jgi:GNAT superfamily N-acetyltransferase
MRIADDTAIVVLSRIERAGVVVGSCSDCGPAASAEPILRQLDPRNRDLISDLVREIGPSVCPQPAVMAAGRENPDVESNSSSAAVAWMVAACFSGQPAGVISARGNLSGGSMEARLFVGAAWRRRGVGALLLKAALDWASCRRAHTLRIVCARDDWPMRHFVEKFDARLDLMFGQIVADFPLAERICEQQRAPPNC